MEPLVVETTLEIGDWQALQAYLKRRALGESGVLKRVLWRIALGVLVFAVLLGSGFVFGKDATPQVSTGFILGLLSFLILILRQATAFRPTRDSLQLAPIRLRLDANGVHATRVGMNGLTEWGAVQAIDETALHVFLALDRTIAYVIPKRSITSMTPAEFVTRARALRDAFVAANASTQAPSSTVAAPEPITPVHAEPLPAWMTVRAPALIDQPPFWPSLKSNLLSGMRVLLGRIVSASAFVATFDQVIGLLAVILAVGAVLDWERAPAGATFDSDGLYSWALWLSMSVLVCALIARAQSAATETRKVLVVALSVAPWVIAILWALQKIPALAESDDAFSILMIATILVVGILVTRTSQGFLSVGPLIIVLVASMVLSRADQYIWLDTHTWRVASHAGESDDDSYGDWDASESLLFNEPERIAEAADSLAPERPGVSDVYYVGFAGDGSQQVFRREALFGEKVFANSMGSGQRSLELINDEDDRIAYPLGTMSGLRYALSLLGSRMNTSEDVLVLFLTSHGSQEDGISVLNGGVPLNDIEPEQIRRALDASGIKWRIVIVSACYAGIFVEPLEDDNTLVITAADAEHTSFGCADDRDLTYFGEAFLRDALPKATSLERAFTAARAAIRAREKQEKLTPSNPQMHLGDAMREKLASLGPLPLERPLDTPAPIGRPTGDRSLAANP